MTETPPSGTRTPRILLIDDDGLVLRTYTRALRACGYLVDAASTADDGLAALDRVEYDAVFSDIVMPGLTGIDLLQAVRSRGLDVPVVLVTGNPRLETAVRAIEAGVARYLVKPVSLDELGRSAAAAIQTRRPTLAAPERSSERPLEHRFDQALGALTVVFQPVVSWSGRRVYGYEALLRVPDFSGPPAFLDAAERLGRLRDVGACVRRTVAAAAPAAPPGVALLVNLHPMDLLDDDLYRPDAPLARVPCRVILELTERASLDAIDDLAGRRALLRDLGYRLAIDDLGEGYAGLSSLVELSPELVKLDMSLVRGVDSDPARQSVVSALTHLARELHMEVIAEGIETDLELDTLVRFGCDLLQGYRIGRPAPGFAALDVSTGSGRSDVG